MTTLYKRDKKGNLLQWSIAHDEISYWTIAGRTDGKLQTTAPTYVTQKNVGKANETSLEQQVINEVESKIKYQLDHGYSKEIPGDDKPFAVSLADKYPDRQAKGKLEFPYIVQPKYDGLRCYMCLEDGAIVMKSRNGKPFVSCKHLTDNPFIKSIFDNNPDIILDGELYNHELKNDFNKIVSLVKKSKPTEEDLKESEKLVQYHIFDVFYKNDAGLTYSQRNKKFVDEFDSLAGQSDDLNALSLYYKLVFKYNYPKTGLEKLTTVAENEGDAENLLEFYIGEGYEGIMLKKDVPYFFGRSTDLLKYKRFKDSEYKILDFEEGKGNLAGIAAAVICVADNGETFKAGVTGTQEYAKDLFANKGDYIGKLATIKYQELTPEKDGKGGVPRFGKMMSIRNYE